MAPINRPVLLIGERGTGKELAAARLHYLSGRWERPFVTLNCASLAPTLIEAELFGHERGAFTGALQRRAGRFEAAEGGTLFLDEIGNVPLEVQGKILRVVEYNSFERVGSAERIDVDVRIVAATNADLRELVRRDRFKADLLDRLSFEVLVVPPLRARRGDVPLLARHFAARMAKELGREEAPVLGEMACAALERHPWPGNVRELKNAVERAVYRADAPLIAAVEFDPFHSPYAPGGTRREQAAPAEAPGAEPPRRSLKEATWSLQVSMLEEALARSRHNQRKAAVDLGLSYNQFRGLYRRYRAGLRGAAAAGRPG
ncbi:MAG: sigma 54-interacting transcriptional regulator [Desulfobacterales bacterium]|nr:sigma 54-interacting transcriptional regulator [Desulfobacterales bacterium]